MLLKLTWPDVLKRLPWQLTFADQIQKESFFLNCNIRLLFCTAHGLLLKNVKLAGMFSMKKRQKCKSCGFRKWGKVHELVLLLSFVDINAFKLAQKCSFYAVKELSVARNTKLQSM